MKQLILLVFLIFFISGLQAQDSSKARPIKQAEISFTEILHDFGTVSGDTTLVYRFIFRNLGQDTLRIYRLKSSWGCTAALLSSGAIAPGDSGKIKVTFDTNGHQGPFEKTIRVYSNDVKKPVIRLIIKGQIKSPAKNKK